MIAAVTLEDPEDPRFADYVDLSDPDLRRRVEAERQFFIAESPLVVRRLLGSGRQVRSVLVTPAQYEALSDILDSAAMPVYVASDAVLRRVVGFDLHRGAVASAERWALPSVDVVVAGAQRIAVLERVNDHENLGVLFRSAAALGVDAILLDAESADPFYRRCVRVSIGTVCTLRWTRVQSLDDVAVPKIALTPRADAMDIADVAWPPRCALLFGAEGPGLSEEWLRAADVCVRIPMHDGSDSLNVATAASIAFYAARAT